MKPLRLLAGLVVLLASPLVFAQGPKCELAILNEKTWDKYVPKGKEVDAIYGDFVLRNDQIVVVVANPVAGRNANMTVKDVGGAIIDLTTRNRQSDQLSAYYPGARRFPYRDAKVLLDNAELIALECVAPATEDRPEATLRYTLNEGQGFVEVRSMFVNKSDKPMPITLVDDFRADRTFTTAKPGETNLAWFYDKWWGQAYGVTAIGSQIRLTGSPLEPRVIEFLIDGKPTVQLEPGKSFELVRHVFPGADLVAVRATAARLDRERQVKLVKHVLTANDANGKPIPRAEISLTTRDNFYGVVLTDADGKAQLDLPAGNYQATVTALARGSKEFSFEVVSPNVRDLPPPIELSVELPAAPRVVAEISNESGKPIPCKVQFVGVDGTPSPYFFEDTGEHAVRNLYYSHNGRFTQEILPGSYDVLISYGPEYDVEKVRIEAKEGEDVPLHAKLRRVVNSPGWVSTDFHSHSSPSGDNVSSQLGRVLNLIAEHIEFAPCTEHNRLDTYVPHLKALGVEHLLATCTGMELTGTLGTINHQNAFPLVLKPRTQDNGAPLIDTEPELQIKRLALWDNGSEKLVQQNHPDMGEMFYDRDGDGEPDEGYKGMFAYQDVIEVHPIHDAINFSPLRYAMRDVPSKDDPKTKIKVNYQYNNSIFNWLQLINQGRRLPGVVNTDAHYNFHGSGYIRNYVKCQTDDPAKIDPIDIVRASEKGHIILTNGPYLEVTLYDSDAGTAASGGERRSAIPGDDLALPGGFGSLHVRVQCPNWFDIDRVQVLLNGKPDAKFNWTRSANADAFFKDGGAVKFIRKIPIEFKTDAHVIVIAASENSEIGPVMGPEFGKHKPAAISNPIFVDADGGGFKANGDTLGSPLPVRQQREVPKQNATR